MRSAVLLGATAGLWAAAVDDAKAAWLAPVSASGVESRVEDPQVGIDAAGNATVVWTSGDAPSRSIRSAFRPAGGSWEPDPLARMSSSFDCHDPRLAVGPAGAAVLVAECEKNALGNPAPAIRAAYRPAASWNGSIEIPGSAGGSAPRVGIAASGDADAVWAGPGSTVLAAHRPAAGPWGSGAQVSPLGKVALDPNLAVSSAGYAHAIWREQRNGYAGDPVIDVRTSRRSPGPAGTWVGPTLLTANFGPGSTTPVAVGEPQIAIGVHGRRMMAWGQQGTNLVMTERVSPGDLSSIEPAMSIAETGDDVEVPRIAVDDSGLGVATWRTTGAGTFPIRGATTSFPTGPWSAKTTLGGPTSVGALPALAAAPDGRATVVWIYGGSVLAATRPAGGAFPSLSPTTVSGPGLTGFQGATVTMTGAGDALVAWSTAARVAVAIDDVTPPAVSATAPAPAAVGSPVALSASATDAWSTATIAWDFGDGASGSGASVTHAYAAAGTYAATATATDAAGNSSTAAVPVTVAASGLPGGGGGDGGRDGGAGPGGSAGPTAPGGSAGSTAPGRDGAPTVHVSAKVSPRAWAKTKKTKALKVRCKLDVAGRCGVVATVTAAVARRLGLPAPKKGSAGVRIGSGAASVRAGRPTVVTVRLAARALRRIAAAARPVPVALAVTGTAPRARPGTASSRTMLRPTR